MPLRGIGEEGTTAGVNGRIVKTGLGENMRAKGGEMRIRRLDEAVKWGER